MTSAETTAPVKRRRVQVGDISERVLEAGPQDSTEAVVLMHGNPGSSDDWERLAGALGTFARVVALDLPDFGETEAPDGFTHDVPTYADFLNRALEALGIRRVHLVVHDFGGPIGLVWAAGHPDMVASLTLINIGALPGYRWHQMARIWRTPVLGELVQAISTRRLFVNGIRRDEPPGFPREFAERMHRQYDRRTRRAVLRLYRATDDPAALSDQLHAAFGQVDTPTLVIWGAQDPYISSSYAERQREVFTAADVHLLPNSGHFPFADAPEDVERLLVPFIRSVYGPGPE